MYNVDKLTMVQSGFAGAVMSELNDVMIQLGLQQYITATYKYMYEMGRRHGALGVLLNNVSDVAKVTAQEMFRHVYVMLKEGLEAAFAEKKTRLRIMETDKQNHQRYRAYYDYVQRQYRSSPRSYSWLFCACCFFIGLAFILIAIPLPLALMQQGFNITDSMDNDKILAKLLTGPFWQIINLDGTQIIAGTGISTCIAYLIFFYDDFSSVPQIGKTLTFNRFVQQNRVIVDLQGSRSASHSIKKIYAYKRWGQIVLAVMAIVAIVVLAFFRLTTASQSNDWGFTFIHGTLFAAVVVLFPVISGFCFAYSMGNLRNIVRLARIDHHCIRLRTKHLYSVEAYAMAQKKYEDLFASSLYLGDEANMIGGYHDSLLAFYQRGFNTAGKDAGLAT